MKDKEDTRLMALAKSLVQGNRKNAIRICHKQIQSVMTPGKRAVWEVWHTQFVKQDNKPIEITSYGKKHTVIPSDHEFMTILLEGMDSVVTMGDLKFNRVDYLKDRFKQRMIDLEYDYHNARLSYLLLGHIQELNQSSKESSAQKNRRRRPVTAPTKISAPQQG